MPTAQNCLAPLFYPTPKTSFSQAWDNLHDDSGVLRTALSCPIRPLFPTQWTPFSLAWDKLSDQSGGAANPLCPPSLPAFALLKVLFEIKNVQEEKKHFKYFFCAKFVFEFIKGTFLVKYSRKVYFSLFYV